MLKIKIGDTIKALYNGKDIIGKVVEIQTRYLIIFSGNKFLKLNQSDCENITKIETKDTSTIVLVSDYRRDTPSSLLVPELYIRHMECDTALMELDIFLNDAYLQNVKRVKIIHGKGIGTLRNAVHNYLKKNTHVESYSYAGYYDGQHGVTIVNLK